MTELLTVPEGWRGSEHALTATPSLSKFTPFDTNYTLTGLVKHIETNLAELIKAKQTVSPSPSHPAHIQLQKLVKIHEDVAVLRTIIIHNINQIFSNIYPHKPDPNTNHTSHTPDAPSHHPPSKRQTGTHSSREAKEMAITEFEADVGIDRGDRINNLQVNRQTLTHHNAIYSQDSERMLVYGSEECEADRVEHMRNKLAIKPFQLIDCNTSNIRIEDDNQFQLDFVCYEDGSSIPRSNIWKSQEKRREQFSPILERPVEEEETVGKCSQGNPNNMTFLPASAGLNGCSQKEIQKKLFAKTARPILPKRCHRKKFNYLDQAQQM